MGSQAAAIFARSSEANYHAGIAQSQAKNNAVAMQHQQQEMKAISKETEVAKAQPAPKPSPQQPAKQVSSVGGTVDTYA